MTVDPKPDDNVKQLVPLLMVASMERSLKYYVDGLGFTRKNQWVVNEKIRWCWLALGGTAVMLQEISSEGRHPRSPQGPVGEGVSLWFQCEDAIAIYRQLKSRGIGASEPQIGNGLWDARLIDPDGYELHFESPTDVPDETKPS